MLDLFDRKLILNVVDDSGEGVDLGKLKVTFEVSRTANGLPVAKIVVVNLSEDTVSRITKEFTRIQLDAGYEDRSGIIFDGQIRNTFTTKHGTDKITEIFASDRAREYERSVVSLSLQENTTLRDTLKAIVASFGDIPVASIDKLTDRVLNGPRTFMQPSHDALDSLSESYGFKWQIHNGQIEFFDKLGDIGGGPIEVSAKTGMVGSPRASTTGVEVVTLINPNIRPGASIRIETVGAQAIVGTQTLSTTPVNVIGVNGGVFPVRTARHIGDTRGQPWYTIVSTLYGSAA